jgi:hypothetical protein
MPSASAAAVSILRRGFRVKESLTIRRNIVRRLSKPSHRKSLWVAASAATLSGLKTLGFNR